MADNSCVHVVYTACIVLILWMSSVVKGQPVFQTPEVARYMVDSVLTCEIAFNPGTGRSWKKNGASVTSGAVDVSGTGRYSERSNSSSFSLVISAAVVFDEADYNCDYNFVASDTKKLLFERGPTKEGMSVTRNSDNKMEIGISNVYPNATVDLVTVQAEGETMETLTGTLAETGSGDYYNYTWTSVDVIDNGKYECKITVTTRSTTVIVLDVTFEPKCCSCCCCCICCFIVLIVCVALGLVFCGGHIGLTWTNHEHSVKKRLFFENNETEKTNEAVYLKDYAMKVVVPECCICVLVIIIQIAVYFAALKQDCIEHCDDDCCGVVVCLVVTIIVSIVKNAIESGIIYFVVHVKGQNYTDQGGNGDSGDSACCGRKNSILPICTGGDQHPQDAKQLPQRPQRGDADKHKSGEPKSNTTKTDEAGSFVSGRDVKVDTGGSSSWRAQPRPLPGIKSEKNTRGLSANIDDSDTNPSYEKKRLTPIGQESQLGWEEKPDRSEDGKEKKKKRKSKEKEKDSNITESADL